MSINRMSHLNDFTNEVILNRNLIIEMLKYEDKIIHGDLGQKIYNDNSYEHYTSHEAMYAIHRIVLSEFGFKTNDSDVSNYRKIFIKYYKSPSDYDKEVMDSVSYMRENKCLYYVGKDFKIGDFFEDVKVFNLDGVTKVSLFDKIKADDKYTLVGAFSTS
jgi:hypothetical protein